MTITKQLFSGLCALTVFLWMTTPTLAQQNDVETDSTIYELDEIIISASKYEQSLQSVGRNVTVISQEDIQNAVMEAVENQDSIGGIIECTVNQLPVGLGEPFFDSFESVMSHMAFSIPAIKGIEFGAGFQAARMKGSEHNDNFITKNGNTETNHAGGINGGITNGNPVIFRVAVKPTSSTHQSQRTLNFKTGKLTDLQVEGRHDTCIALRVPVVLEAATAIVTADLMLQSHHISRILNPKNDKTV